MPDSLPFRPALSLLLVRVYDTVPPVVRTRDVELLGTEVRGGLAITPLSVAVSVVRTVSSVLFRFGEECAGGAVQDKMASL